MAEAPLDTLCSICYTSPPKYRCPRCPSIRTCSLPCYKRHQQRATCTGQRNESTYVKKSQLSTAAGLDHDYNFLTKIERAFRTADAASADERPSKRRKLGSHPGFVSYLAENHITVQHAPPGLHRAKTNQSRFLPKSKKVAWTVEWIDDAGTKRTTEVLDDAKVGDAHASMAARAAKEERRRSHDNGNKTGATTSTASAGQTKQAEPTPTQPEPAKPSEPPDDPGKQTANPDPTTLPSAPTEPPRSTDEATPQGATHLYLHRPRALSSTTVLIPLPLISSLTTVLTHRTLDEYPTIYHLPFAPSSLPSERYTLNTAYEAKLKSDLAGLDREEIVRAVDTVLDGKTGWAKKDQEKEKEEDEGRWDEKRVLEMLRRDVGALRR